MTYLQFGPAAHSRVPWTFGAKIGPKQPFNQKQIVPRQNIWHKLRRRLAECLPRHVGWYYAASLRCCKRLCWIVFCVVLSRCLMMSARLELRLSICHRQFDCCSATYRYPKANCAPLTWVTLRSTAYKWSVWGRRLLGVFRRAHLGVIAPAERQTIQCLIRILQGENGCFFHDFHRETGADIG